MSSKKYIIIGMFFFLVATVGFANTITYKYELTGAGETRSLSMTVQTEGDITEIVMDTEKNEKEVIQLKNGDEILNVKYYNAQGKLYLKVVYDYQQKKVLITGAKTVTINLKARMYDHNGSLFYIFGRVHPGPNQKLSFYLLQSKLGRYTEMYLKSLGAEVINLNGEKVKAEKYEMGLPPGLASLFWQYKYYYWYRADNHTFIKYEGPDENKKNQTILLSKSEEF